MKVHRSRLLAIKHNMRVPLYRRLAIAFIGLQCADVATTAIALHVGLTESNPLLRMVLDRNPFAAYSIKLLLMSALGLFTLTFLHPRSSLLIVSGVTLFAVVSNILSIIIR